ncbi:type II toxin-antitoxin system VapC family toxin [Pedobacter helvus]|uniref:Type II toxin-antitoxin system VapC family toxin n=1 Tax=Pedobacter helvus TaxID=2563444 RepID=A0ABW9JD45_9SPHI|nr:type II toxin-antitoxin system VapC family toxin [Pedobacter ureilyticus]
MSGNKVLLDINIISALLKGETSIADEIDKASQIFLSATVIGELFYGAQYSIQIESNIRNIKKLVLRYEVLNIDAETSAIYGIIKATLRRNGTPIPENDIWIAATAIQHKLALSTRDKHFNQIKDLNVLAW